MRSLPFGVLLSFVFVCDFVCVFLFLGVDPWRLAWVWLVLASFGLSLVAVEFDFVRISCSCGADGGCALSLFGGIDTLLLRERE